MSSGGSDSYDAAYNNRIATMMEEAQGWSREDRDWEKANVRPYQEAVAKMNMGLLPLQESNIRAITEGKGSLINPIFEGLQKGSNIDGQVGSAVNDLYSAFDKSDVTKQITGLRMGIDPTSNAWSTKMGGIDKAKAEGLVRSSTRRDAENLDLTNKIKGLAI